MWGSGRRAREVMPEAIRAEDIDRGAVAGIRKWLHATDAGASAGCPFRATAQSAGSTGSTDTFTRRRLPGSKGRRER